MSIVKTLRKAFSWHGFVPLVPLERCVTENQYKVHVTNHIYPVMKHFYPDWSGLCNPHPIVMRAKWIVWMKIMSILCHGFHSHQITTQVNKKKSSGRMAIISIVQFYRLAQLMPRRTEVVLVACSGRMPYLIHFGVFVLIFDFFFVLLK